MKNGDRTKCRVTVSLPCSGLWRLAKAWTMPFS